MQFYQQIFSVLHPPSVSHANTTQYTTICLSFISRRFLSALMNDSGYLIQIPNYNESARGLNYSQRDPLPSEKSIESFLLYIFLQLSFRGERFY